jgi:Ca2+-binding EF-hand superfamily protein
MKLFVVTITAAALAGPVLAQPPATGATAQPGAAQSAPAGMGLQDLQTQQWSRLAMLDSDKDGRISRAEWDAVAAMAPGQLSPALWERLDTNKDGFVTREELNVRVAASFPLMDANHDNVVTADEMQAYQAQAMRRMQAGQPPAAPAAPSTAPKPPPK